MQSSLNVLRTSIDGVLIIEPKIFGDDRGWFFESFNASAFFSATGLNFEFVQDNHSFSRQWTLRGMHYQTKEPQGKLVRVCEGEVFDVVVDLRISSPTYGKWFGVKLSSKNFRQLWAPPGVAHGFLVLSTTAETLYKVTSYYDPNSEVSLIWNDPTINIDWKVENGIDPIISPKDRSGVAWEKAPKF